MADRLVQAEINLANFSKNFLQVKKLVGKNVSIMAVVKANAYGHGAIAIAKKAVKLGASYLGVSCIFEAKELRQAGISTPILLLGYTDKESVASALDLDLTVNVMDREILQEIITQTKKRKKRASVHVKIDTGMHRIGVPIKEAVDFIQEIRKYKNVYLEGIYTHFAAADARDLSFTKIQLEKFQSIISRLAKMGIKPPIIHAANSAAVLFFPKSHLTMVRPGKILYGPLPTTLGNIKAPFIAKPLLTLKTIVSQIRVIKKGESVGYGREFVADSLTRVGAIPVGYADGFRRTPSFGEVLVRGKRVKLIGRVSMDQSSIDLTHISNASVGDEVVIIGIQGKDEITTEDVAKRLNTINYDVLTSISKRVTRVYRD